MSLKFTFGGATPAGADHHEHTPATPGIPLPFAGAASRSTSSSSELELRVTLDDTAAHCAGVSGDGVTYAQASRALTGSSPAAVAAAVRSVLARTGAELPEPLIESVTAVTLALGGAEAAALAELGLTVDAGADPLAVVDDALQARTGLTTGTPIRRAE